MKKWLIVFLALFLVGCSKVNQEDPLQLYHQVMEETLNGNYILMEKKNYQTGAYYLFAKIFHEEQNDYEVIYMMDELNGKIDQMSIFEPIEDEIATHARYVNYQDSFAYYGLETIESFQTILQKDDAIKIDEKKCSYKNNLLTICYYNQDHQMYFKVEIKVENHFMKEMKMIVCSDEQYLPTDTQRVFTFLNNPQTLQEGQEELQQNKSMSVEVLFKQIKKEINAYI